MNLVDTILTTLTMLLGEENADYILFEREMEEWQVVSWIHRN